MASPGIAPLAIDLGKAFHAGNVDTQALLTAILQASDHVSDLIFSPGRTPQAEIHGELVPIQASGMENLSADDTRKIAADLIGSNKQAIALLREQGSCDISYGLPGLARFRANVFIQRGSCAVVLRAIPTEIPDLETLGLPRHLAYLGDLRDGLVVVSGTRGSGKSSTLAAIINCINERQTAHIITIEDPIEFLHLHKRSTVHQRELHSDSPSFPMALRSALRQAPRVILVAELRDRETMELVLQAAETGHMVLTSVNSVDVTKTIDRLISAFPAPEQSAIRARLARVLRSVISQRLLPRKDGAGRAAAVEILNVNPQVVTCLERFDHSGQSLVRIMKSSESEGMCNFDSDIGRLIRLGVVDLEAGLRHASDSEAIRRTAQI